MSIDCLETAPNPCERYTDVARPEEIDSDTNNRQEPIQITADKVHQVIFDILNCIDFHIEHRRKQNTVFNFYTLSLKCNLKPLAEDNVYEKKIDSRSAIVKPPMLKDLISKVLNEQAEGIKLLVDQVFMRHSSCKTIEMQINATYQLMKDSPVMPSNRENIESQPSELLWNLSIQRNDPESTVEYDDIPTGG